jgi:inorganic pyrophosphatase
MTKEYLGKFVDVTIDRPMFSKHPKYDFVYPCNYGYIPNTLSGDEEELDAYVIGVKEPLVKFCGKVIAYIKRLDEYDDKLIVSPVNLNFSDEEIESLIYFQEKWFRHTLVR